MLNKVIEIVIQASSLMVDGGFEIMQKDGLENLVTSSDLAVQRFLTEKFSELLPGSGFFCEEEDQRARDEEYIWIIDPIDGTCNYSRGIMDCAISVALARRGEVQLAVVYSPGRDELYSAERGQGAFCNGKPVRVSSRTFADGLLCTAMSTYCKQYAKTCSDIIYDIYMASNDTRRWGTAAVELCLLASGYVELYFEFRLQPWDYAASGFILQEAGGCILGFDGSAPSLLKPSLVVAANSEGSARELLKFVHKHLDDLPY